MALSNIFKEPRRELTEQAIGTGAVLMGIAAFCLADNWLADSLVRQDSPGEWWGARVLAVGVLIIGAILTRGLTLLAHQIGDSICNAFQARGIHLRPRNRATRR